MTVLQDEPKLQGAAQGAETPKTGAPADTSEREGPGQNGGVGQSIDPIEVALADALRRAALADAWDTVQALTSELRARREARAGVVSLEAERARRGEKKP